MTVLRRGHESRREGILGERARSLQPASVDGAAQVFRAADPRVLRRAGRSGSTAPKFTILRRFCLQETPQRTHIFLHEQRNGANEYCLQNQHSNCEIIAI